MLGANKLVTTIITSYIIGIASRTTQFAINITNLKYLGKEKYIVNTIIYITNIKITTPLFYNLKFLNIIQCVFIINLML